MKLERISHNKIKIFLTIDDLMDRGVTKEDMLGNSLKVHKLFQDMVEEACESLDFKMNGSIAIEIYSLQAQGLVIIVTKEEDEYLLEDYDDVVNLQVKFDEYSEILYVFEDFEDVISLCRLLHAKEIFDSTLYYYNSQYYLLIENVEEHLYNYIISLASEYGYASTLTLYKVNEYGSCIIEKKAVNVVTSHFR